MEPSLATATPRWPESCPSPLPCDPNCLMLASLVVLSAYGSGPSTGWGAAATGAGVKPKLLATPGARSFRIHRLKSYEPIGEGVSRSVSQFQSVLRITGSVTLWNTCGSVSCL